MKDNVTSGRTNRISMRISDQEKTTLQEKAQAFGLSLTSYLILVGLEKRLRSKLDQRAVVELGHLRADLGRLGGLLKYWLSGNTAQNPTHHIHDIRPLLQNIDETQQTIKTLVNTLYDR
jgi:hypothetical protein